jgi:type I restriction enzyme S subunit
VDLFQPGDGHDDYVALRDDPDLSEERAWFQKMWEAYAPVNPDKNFLVQFRVRFREPAWQMYVAFVLKHHGFTLNRSPSDGPDLKIHQDRTIWVEAVCPGAGTGADAAERHYRPDNTYRLNRRAMRLRYTAALKEKTSQRQEQVDRHVVADDEPYVVAIGASNIKDADLHKGVPEVVNAVLGLGELVYVQPIGEGNGRWELRAEPEIQNRNKAVIRTDGFPSGEYAEISGVLFASHTPWSEPKSAGDTMLYIPNSTARNKLSRDFFPFAETFWTESDGGSEKLVRRRWSA